MRNLDGLAIIKSDKRGPGFNYRLKTPIAIDQTRLSTFEFVIRGDRYKGKIYQQLGPPPKLGEEVIVTVKRTGLALTDDQLCDWLKLYGTIEGEFRYKYHPELPSVKDDHLEVVMKLARHCPSTLPAFGKKVSVQYRGQPIQCSKCYDLGHTRRNCPSQTQNWLGYVKILQSQNFIPNSYFGVWLDYLRAHESVVSSEF